MSFRDDDNLGMTLLRGLGVTLLCVGAFLLFLLICACEHDTSERL